MASPSHTYGYRTNIDGTAFSFDYRLGTKQEFKVQTYQHDADTAENLTGITDVNVKLYDKPDGTLLQEITGASANVLTGIFEFTVSPAMLSTLTYDLGEQLKVLTCLITLTVSTQVEAVIDDLGNRFFPFRVHWGVAV